MVIMGSGDFTGQRGVSHLVGAVLLIGITMTAAVLIVVAGSGTIGDVNEQNNVEVAGQTFQQTDEAFQEFARQDRNRSATIDLPKSMQGDVEINESSWNLTLNENPECTSGTRRLGEMRYTGEDQTVGYEGGGIWKMTESGATMDSPPKMTYDQGSLSIGFPNLTGQVTSSNRIEVSSNVSRQEIQNQELSKALYTSLDYGETSPDPSLPCSPDEVESAKLTINNSEYASAWARYFERNYDEPYVKVLTTGSIQPGDDVEVEFQLGDVSDPEYNVTDIKVTRPNRGGPVNVVPEITNEGGLEGEPQTVGFEYEKGGTVQTNVDTESVELGSEESKQKDLELDAGDISSGTYNIKVATEDDKSDPIQVKFTDEDGVPDPAILDTAVPQKASTREDVEATVTVENRGHMTAFEDVRFEYKEARTSGWTTVDEDTVTAHPTTPGRAKFKLPTDNPGLFNWRVSMDGTRRQGTYAVGSDPYFSLGVNGPGQVSTAEDYELDVTIENAGDLQGTMPVEVTIERNEGSDWTQVDTYAEDVTVDGSVYSSNQVVLDSFYRNRSTVQGEYRYTVETPNETTSETFHVGPPDNPTLVVDGVEITDNPTTLNANTQIDVTVKNVGVEQANQIVRVQSEDGASLVEEAVVVGPDETATVTGEFQTDDNRFDVGHHPLTVRTANASVSKTLVLNNRTNVGEDGVNINRKVVADVQVLGTELEGPIHRDSGTDVKHAVTEMWLEVEHQGQTEREDLWEDKYDGNVNHPAAEKAMIENSSSYTVTRTFPGNSNVSVFARSYHCSDPQATDVVFEGIMPEGEDARGYACKKGGERITINDDANSGNVEILMNGQEVPAYDAAAYYQRNLEDMLGHRINDDGTLSLGQDEFVFLYELSRHEANPKNASGEDDPDYNDAVGLFRVVDVERTEEPPANFAIENVEAPASVPPGEDAQIAVTVNNTGGETGSTNVHFDMEGQDTLTGETGTLEPGETDTVLIDIPTDVEPATYQYTVLLSEEPTETHHGAITIGQTDGPNFQVTTLDAPNVAETDEDPTATVEVTNTGTKAGSQTVQLVENPYHSSDVVDSTRISLDRGETTSVDLDLPSRGTHGWAHFKVETDDATTSEQRIYYGKSSVGIDSLAIGTSTYANDGSLIERRYADKMSFKLENNGDVGGTRDVTLEIRNDSGWSRTPPERHVQVGKGHINSTYPKWVRPFTVDLDPGYYEYTLTVRNDGNVEDTWEGELFINQNAEVGGQRNSSSPISVDSNEVVISG